MVAARTQRSATGARPVATRRPRRFERPLYRDRAKTWRGPRESGEAQMTRTISRRTLLGCAGMAAPLWHGLGFANTPVTVDPNRLRLRPFDLRDVRLQPGPALDAANVNRKYLMGLEPDR